VIYISSEVIAESKSKSLNSLVLVVVVLATSQCASNQYILAQPQISDPELKIDVVAKGLISPTSMLF